MSWEGHLTRSLSTLPICADQGLWAVSICRNEEARLPAFFSHYKCIGISNFLIIDNNSSDHSAEIIDEEVGAHRVLLNAAYAEFKSRIRTLIGDCLFQDKWVLFVDIDEHFVFPGYEGISINRYIRGLEERRAEASLSIMVDMYPEKLIAAAKSSSGILTSYAPLFDGGGYWVTPLNKAKRTDWPTPGFDIQGGALNRLFFGRRKTLFSAFECAGRLLMSTSRLASGDVSSRVQNLVFSLLQKASEKLRDQSVSPPKLQKIVLLRWKKGSKFSGGVHRIDREYELDDEPTFLLHYKLLWDFAAQVEENKARAMHADGAKKYKAISAHMRSVIDGDIPYWGSIYFSGYDSLLRVWPKKAQKWFRYFLRNC